MATIYVSSYRENPVTATTNPSRRGKAEVISSIKASAIRWLRPAASQRRSIQHYFFTVFFVAGGANPSPGMGTSP